MLIINAEIHVMDEENKIIPQGYVLIRGSEIVSVGEMSSAPSDKDEEVYDADGEALYPGFIDAHTHLGLFESGLTFEGDDGNEDTDPVTPQLRSIDGTNPMDEYFRQSMLSGVTSVLISPGSTNPVAGQIAAIKTYGRRIDKMIIKSPAAMKFSLGENPKSTYNDKDQAPVTRMGIAAIIRETLIKAKRYHMDKLKYEADKDNNDEPEYDFRYEALCPLFTREIPAHFHAHRADDIFTAIRIAEEFDIRCVIVHGTEAALIADELEGECEGIISGPFLTDRSKPELKHVSPASANVIVSRKGLRLAITTDHPETPLPYIRLCAAVAVSEGLDPVWAMRSITSDAAKISGIYDRVGSVEAGKDADLVLFRGNPLDIMHKPVAVITGGVLHKSDALVNE